MNALIWLHHDALSLHHPVFKAAPKDARSIFIWDADDLARRNWSLKRCVFVLECLAEMDVDIVRGDALTVLTQFDADNVFMAETPDPYFRQVATQIRETLTIVPAETFVTLPEGADMGRFFRYWNKAKRSALRRA